MNAHKMLVFRIQNISKKKSQPNQIHAVVLCFLRPVVVSLYAVIESKQYGQNEITEFDNKMYFQWLHKSLSPIFIFILPYLSSVLLTQIRI